MIEFISHQEFPDDPYCKEIVYLVLDGKYKVAYVAKLGKTGNKFWDVMSTGTVQNGERTYHRAFEYDSNFQKEEALKLIASKPWEKNQSVFNAPPAKSQQVAFQQPDFFDPGEPPF